MRSTKKTILFTRLTVGKTSYMWPVAVFNTPVAAKTYAAYIKMAHTSNNAEMAKMLDGQTKTDDDGKLYPGAKLSIKTVGYEPTPASGTSEEDVIEEEPTE